MVIREKPARLEKKALKAQEVKEDQLEKSENPVQWDQQDLKEKEDPSACQVHQDYLD